MKSIKFFSFFISALVLLAFTLIIFRIFFNGSPTIPFIYGLKTTQTHTTHYLPESKASQLSVDKNTVGIFSTRKEHFLLKEIFQTAGVPYIFTNTLKSLKDTKIIFLDFDINIPQTLNEEDKQFLYSFVAHGGTLIGNEILPTRNGILKELFGYKSFIPTQSHHKFTLKDSKFYTYFDTEEEKNYTLSTMTLAPYSNNIILGSATAIASYEDNQTAISLNHYKKGITINLGISLFDLRYRNLLGKDFQANENYINHFEPLSDFIVLFIKGIYEQTLTDSLTLHTSKNGNQATVIMTHDIKNEDAVKNIDKFIHLEKSLHIKSSYIIQTKYSSDTKNKAFLTIPNLRSILNAQDYGHEIASNGIFDIENFFLLPSGECNISYSKYKPSHNNAQVNACAEIKISKELLLGMGVKEVSTFRGNNLQYHPDLPKLLESFGYKYSSSFSAEDILSYFPYRHMSDYKTLKVPSKIWEIPLVQEDTAFPPLYFKVKDSLHLFQKIYNNGAMYTMLVHPDLTLYKLKNLDLKFMKEFYESIPKDVWKTSLNSFGKFWDMRDRIIFRYTQHKKSLLLTVSSKAAINGLTFQFKGYKFAPSTQYIIQGNKIILNVLKGENKWQLKLQ